MKKSAFYSLPIFCFVYYIMLNILYGGNIYVVSEGHFYHVPIDWALLIGNVLYIVLSFMLIAFIKNKLCAHLILAFLSVSICTYGTISMFKHIKVFTDNQSYSLPLFAAMFTVCFAFLTIMHLITAFKKKESNTNENA